MTTCIRISWDAYKNTKSRTLWSWEHWTELEWAGVVGESAFLKSAPRWFLCKLKFESHCCKGCRDRRSFRKILCLWHTQILNVQLMPDSGCYQGLKQVQKPGGTGGSQKGHHFCKAHIRGKELRTFYKTVKQGYLSPGQRCEPRLGNNGVP